MNQFWLRTERRIHRVKNKLGLAAFWVTRWHPHPGFWPVLEKASLAFEELIMPDALKLIPEKVQQMNLNPRESVHLCGRGQG